MPLCCSMYQYCVPCYGQIIFYALAIPRAICPLIISWIFQLFSLYVYFLMANDVLHLFTCLLPIRISSLEKHPFRSLANFLIVFNSVQSLSHVQLFDTPWTAACQASLSITNSRSLLKLMFIESVMPSNHLILCHPLLLLPSIFPSIRVFSDESALCIRWPNCWSFNFSTSLSDECSGLISFRIDWLDLLAGQGTLKSLL